jgi:hypothetical protein
VAHNAESRDLCFAPNVFCVIKTKEYDVGGAGSTLGGGIEMPLDFGGEIRERLLLRPKCEDNIKKDFKGILWEDISRPRRVPPSAARGLSRRWT